MAAALHHLLVERLEEEALHVHLGETIDDGHPVDFFVVLGLDVLPRQVLEDRGTDLDAVAVAEPGFALDLLVVHVRAVRRAVVDAPPRAAPLLEVSVPARETLSPSEHRAGLWFSSAPLPMRIGAAVEDEPPPEQGRLLRVDDGTRQSRSSP